MAKKAGSGIRRRSSSRIFEFSSTMLPEERAKFDSIFQDLEVQKILPNLKAANVIIVQKLTTKRFEKMRPMSAVCKSIRSCDNIDEVR